MAFSPSPRRPPILGRSLVHRDGSCWRGRPPTRCPAECQHDGDHLSTAIRRAAARPWWCCRGRTPQDPAARCSSSSPKPPKEVQPARPSRLARSWPLRGTPAARRRPETPHCAQAQCWLRRAGAMTLGRGTGSFATRCTVLHRRLSDVRWPRDSRGRCRVLRAHLAGPRHVGLARRVTRHAVDIDRAGRILRCSVRRVGRGNDEKARQQAKRSEHERYSKKRVPQKLRKIWI